MQGNKIRNNVEFSDCGLDDCASVRSTDHSFLAANTLRICIDRRQSAFDSFAPFVCRYDTFMASEQD